MFREWRQEGKVLCLMFAIMAMAMIAIPAHAQDAIRPGDNKLAQVLVDQPARFQFDGQIGQTLTLDVLAITPGLSPSVTVKDDDATVIISLSDTDDRGRVVDDLILNRSGNFIVEVGSGNEVTGQVVLSLAESSDQVETTDLTINQAIDGQLTADNPLHRYAFNQSPTEGLVLTIQNQGAEIKVQNQDSGELEASIGANVRDTQLDFPAGSGRYVMTASYGDRNVIGQYKVELRSETTIVAEPVDSSPVPVQPVAAACLVTPRSQNVNFRNSPGLGSGIIGSLRLGTQGEAIGRLIGNDWYQLNLNGLVGWVSASVVNTNGDCPLVPLVSNVVVQNPPPVIPQPTTQPQPFPQPTEEPPAQPTQPGTEDPQPTEDPEPQPVALGDLTVASVTDQVTESGDVIFSITVVNQGNAAVGPFLVSSDAPTANNGGTAQRREIPGLIPGQSQSFTINPYRFQNGEHFLNVLIDVANEITESNESNNNRQHTFTHIDLEPRPDLVGEVVGVNATDSGALVFAITVTNQGTAPAGTFRVSYGAPFTTSAIHTRSDAVAGLGAGESHTFTTRPGFTFLGTANHEFTVVVDRQSQVAESIEGNNYVVHPFSFVDDNNSGIPDHLE